ncbi:MAG: DUF3291 domain-containing protein [Actinomycetota bacterium]|nr:DUF3291 domain-containing protein [Acidimicrobiia bacterium]MDQ3294324.1 DUF3291 domain-containing protein [Actinomycetota bacterium]
MTEGDRFELAQINVARLLQPLDHPDTAGFVEGLDPINELADGSPGFVWRLQTDEGNATSVRAYDDPLMIVNVSVWTSVEALADFTYRSAHAGILRHRRSWFEKPAGPILVLWWIPAGHRPPPEEGIARLAHLTAHGPTPTAFTLRERFGAHETADAEPVVDDRSICPA